MLGAHDRPAGVRPDDDDAARVGLVRGEPRAPADGDGGDAYWLYALSNAGSLLALLAYPFVVEPRLGLSAQRGVWAVGFVAVRARDRAACAALGEPPSARPSAAVAAADAADAAAPSRLDRLAPARDVAAARGRPVGPADRGHDVHRHRPRLGAAPLARAARDLPRDVHRRVLGTAAGGSCPARSSLAPAAVTLMWVPYGSAGGWPILPLVLLMYGGLARGRDRAPRPARPRPPGADAT